MSERCFHVECLLRKKLINQYDWKKCKEKLEELLDEYVRVKYTYKNLCTLGDDFYTKGMGYKFSDTPSSKIGYNDRIGNNIAFKIDSENEAERMQQDIDSLLIKLTDQEKDYFKIVLLQKRAQRIVEDKYRITKTALEPIKYGCIIKSCLHFGIAVKK